MVVELGYEPGRSGSEAMTSASVLLPGGGDVLWSGESDLKTAFLQVAIYLSISPTSALLIEAPAVGLVLRQVLWLRGE